MASGGFEKGQYIVNKDGVVYLVKFDLSDGLVISQTNEFAYGICLIGNPERVWVVSSDVVNDGAYRLAEDIDLAKREFNESVFKLFELWSKGKVDLYYDMKLNNSVHEKRHFLPSAQVGQKLDYFRSIVEDERVCKLHHGERLGDDVFNLELN